MDCVTYALRYPIPRVLCINGAGGADKKDLESNFLIVALAIVLPLVLLAAAIGLRLALWKCPNCGNSFFWFLAGGWPTKTCQGCSISIEQLVAEEG